MSKKSSIDRKKIIDSLNSFVEDKLREYQKPLDKYWQPADYLPDFSKDEWLSEVNKIRDEASELPDELFVVLVGDMITEEALPSYQSWFNGLDHVKDETGVSKNPWAKWIRGWTAEENRHGDLLSGYLSTSGKVDMKAINRSVQSLIKAGFNPSTNNDPYAGLIYTSFQERATKVSHRNTGAIAAKYGAQKLQKICAVICSDEKRHEEAYQMLIKEILTKDPNGVVLELERMLKATIVMPGKLVEDGFGNNLFDSFSKTAQYLNVYTPSDYASILQYLLKLWSIDTLTGLSVEAQGAQEYICKLPERYERIASRSKVKKEKICQPWILNKEISVGA